MRDTETWRNILLYIAESDNKRKDIAEKLGSDNDYLNKQLDMLIESDYVEAKEHIQFYQRILFDRAKITQKGYDFLEPIQSEKMWSKTKNHISKKNVHVSISSVRIVSKMILEKQLL